MKNRFVAVAVLMTAAAPRAMACPGPLQQVAAARDLASAMQAQQAVIDAGALCSAEQRAWAGNITATWHQAEAQRLLRDGAPVSAALAVVDRGLQSGRPWHLLRMRGELLAKSRDAQGRVNWAEASKAFQQALNDIQDRRGPPEPTRADIEGLIGLAEQTRMIALGIVRAPATRSGEPGGLELPAVRDIEVRQVAQPIHFVWNTAEFTDQGRLAADQLAEMLARQGEPAITLIGHCDKTGPDDFNMALSRQRAEMVRRYLEDKGYPPGRIATEGRGWHDPVPPAEEGIYSPEEYDQILRRVVLVRR